MSLMRRLCLPFSVSLTSSFDVCLVFCFEFLAMAAYRALAAALLRSSTGRSSPTGFRSASLLSSNVGSGSGSTPSRFFSNAVSAASPPHAELMNLARAPVLAPVLLGSVRHYAKRAKKWQGGRHGVSRLVICIDLMINPKP